MRSHHEYVYYVNKKARTKEYLGKSMKLLHHALCKLLECAMDESVSTKSIKFLIEDPDPYPLPNVGQTLGTLVVLSFHHSVTYITFVS